MMITKLKKGDMDMAQEYQMLPIMDLTGQANPGEREVRHRPYTERLRLHTGGNCIDE